MNLNWLLMGIKLTLLSRRLSRLDRSGEKCSKVGRVKLSTCAATLFAKAEAYSPLIWYPPSNTDTILP